MEKILKFLQNLIILLVFAILAIIFKRWWIILFSVILITDEPLINIGINNIDDEEEKE